MKKLGTRQLRKMVKKNYPNAVNVELGDNGCINGIWFDVDQNATRRTFIPCSFQK